MNKKTKRRFQLLDDLLDYALRSECRFLACNGSEAPIRHMLTCTRCACIHRAMKMGLVVKAKETYIRKDENGRTLFVVGKGVREQFSSVDGRRI